MLTAICLLGTTKIKRGLLQPGQERSMPALSLKLLLPPTDYYITYEGSATTPACQETATWILFNRPLYITEQQVCIDRLFSSSLTSWVVQSSTCLLSFDVKKKNSYTPWGAWSEAILIKTRWSRQRHRRYRRPWRPIQWATITVLSNPLIIGLFVPILTSHQLRYRSLFNLACFDIRWVSSWKLQAVTNKTNSTSDEGSQDFVRSNSISFRIRPFFLWVWPYVSLCEKASEFKHVPDVKGCERFDQDPDSDPISASTLGFPPPPQHPLCFWL